MVPKWGILMVLLRQSLKNGTKNFLWLFAKTHRALRFPKSALTTGTKRLISRHALARKHVLEAHSHVAIAT
ncbi:hypothetical protein AciPR4_1603 [Terriglobus saanensis SP1PR4]|uniref:Uncharacterized protein n=1 Tax=Terriglobus saanensis (strain ATCC BAA-1853 / DSM 23119 / SP1PR4) TaxID=401053 RepID=E8V2K2_TERSS|nr:hypothetical protein AciPR4_1603 [Terriglobus saanensis SP1PR4]